MRQRAVLAQDKQQRQQAILDAAQRLLARSPDRVASMSAVADAAGLAKGTVYLYFSSKEQLLLALHERQIGAFFEALDRLLARADPPTIDDMLGLTRRHMVDDPTFLPLATRCFGIMGTEVPADVAAAFKSRMNTRLRDAGAGLERHFAEVPAGGGVALLRQSYALILGLWQIVSTNAAAAADAPTCAMQTFDYYDQLARGLTALWSGTLGRQVRVQRVEA